MTNIEQLGSHMTDIEHFSRDAFQVCRVTRQTATKQAVLTSVGATRMFAMTPPFGSSSFSLSYSLSS